MVWQSDCHKASSKLMCWASSPAFACSDGNAADSQATGATMLLHLGNSMCISSNSLQVECSEYAA